MVAAVATDDPEIEAKPPQAATVAMARPPRLLPSQAWLLLLAGQLIGCATVSFDQPKNPSQAIVDVSDTTLAKNIAAWTREHGGKSGFYPLIGGMDALGVRLYLAEQAEKSIDLQYFLMKDDSAGIVISAALLQAANRGVRVRFLLDDVFTSAPVPVLLFSGADRGCAA